MASGTDRACGEEPGIPVVHRRIVGEKDAALEVAERAGLQVLVGRYSVAKYHGGVAPENLYEVVECPPNLFLTAGVTIMWNLVTATGSESAFNSTNARLCVGNDNATAAAVGQTDLIGASKLRKLVTGAPVVSGRQVTFSSQFETADANFAWLEVGVANGAATSLLSRSAVAGAGLGTKVNTAVWILNWTLGISSTAG